MAGRRGRNTHTVVLILLIIAGNSCSTKNTCNPDGSEPVEVLDVMFDTEFLANQYFFLDMPDSVFSDTTYRPDPLRLNVFVDDFLPLDPEGETQYFAYAIEDTLGVGLGEGPDEEMDGLFTFRMLSPIYDFIPVVGESGVFHGIKLEVPIREHDVLAVSYIAVDPSGNEFTIGDYDISDANDCFSEHPDTLLFELIKPERYHPDSPTWSYMMRNIYSLGGSGIDYNTLEISIVRWAVGEPSHPEDGDVPYITIFGLDHYDAILDSFGHDGVIDHTRIDTQEGLLFFPCLQAFSPPDSLVCEWTTTVIDEDTTCYELLLEDRNPALYNIDHTQLMHDPAYAKYKIRYHWFSQ